MTVCVNGGKHGNTGTQKRLSMSSTRLLPEATSLRLMQRITWAKPGCQKISDERSSRLPANRRCRSRSRWRLFRRDLSPRGRTNCFHREKTFRRRREIERSCSGQIGRPTANRWNGDNRYERGRRLLADFVLCKITRYLGDRDTNGSIR